MKSITLNESTVKELINFVASYLADYPEDNMPFLLELLKQLEDTQQMRLI